MGQMRNSKVEWPPLATWVSLYPWTPCPTRCTHQPGAACCQGRWLGSVPKDLIPFLLLAHPPEDLGPQKRLGWRAI